MAILPRTVALPSLRPLEDAATPGAPLRRCTFRYVKVSTSARSLPVYDIACTFPNREKQIPLGDIDSARPICAACTYQGIFRADED